MQCSLFLHRLLSVLQVQLTRSQPGLTCTGIVITNQSAVHMMLSPQKLVMQDLNPLAPSWSIHSPRLPLVLILHQFAYCSNFLETNKFSNHPLFILACTIMSTASISFKRNQLLYLILWSQFHFVGKKLMSVSHTKLIVCQ